MQLIDRLERHEIEVFASTLVYVEVFNRGELRLRDNSKSQTASTRQRQEAGDIIDQWFRQSGIRWIEVHLDLVEAARALARHIGCESQDAVHLQSALETGCTRFYTIDQKLLKPVEAAGGITGLEVLLPDGAGQQVIS
jgi:predicted nucleic acid-binding protein